MNTRRRWAQTARTRLHATDQARSCAPMLLGEVIADPADRHHQVTWTAGGLCRAQITLTAEQAAGLTEALALTDMARQSGHWLPRGVALPEDLVLLPVETGGVAYRGRDDGWSRPLRFTALSVCPTGEGLAVHAHRPGLPPLALGFLATPQVPEQALPLSLLAVYA